MTSVTLKDLGEKALDFIQEYLKLPTKDVFESIDWSNAQTIIITISIWLVLIILSSATLWILKSVALYTMAKNKDDKYAFLAFVPYGCIFVIGRIIGKNKIWGIEVEKPEYILPLLLLTMLLPFSATISTILFIFFYYGILYRLYKLKWNGFASVATILSFFLPILQPIFLFIIRKK